jgi:EAL domain-containing protein (putative c-di-GMP-specific phosphodiesterase class I)
MDFYVYETVFSFLYLHSLSNEPLIPISVNVSRVHLANVSGFLKRIRSLHNRYPIPPKFITFELTESAYIQELDSAAIFIDGLHQLGYQVSLDDFGSGYSSLKALQSMPFDEIKFDRAFLLDTAHEKENRIFLEIIKLVKNLDLSIVCEGVETAENVNLLEQSDCDIMQGYYYYKPFPLENLTLSFPKTP